MHDVKPSRGWIWLLIAAAGMFVLPENLQTKFRLAAGDLLAPGCQAWTATRGAVGTVLAGLSFVDGGSQDLGGKQAETERLREELADARRQLQRLEILLARQAEAAQAREPVLFAPVSPGQQERLAKPVLTEVAVLGTDSTRAWRKGRWLDQGRAAGLMEEAPILASPLVLIDLGRDGGLSPEDALLLGRAVIGKVHQVGRWTSTVLWVTDTEYRSRAQLVRATGDGYVFGARGVLKGCGDGLCQLDGIPSTEAVDPGDAVYTADRDGLLPSPLYFGTVVEAQLEERSRGWRIRVQPVERPDAMTRVQVLNMMLNSRRVLAN